MTWRNRQMCTIVVLCALLTPAQFPAVAQSRGVQSTGGFSGGIGPSGAQVAGAIAGIAGAGALIGFLAYVAVKHSHAVTGCALSVNDGLQLTSESDKKTYILIGTVAEIKPGNRVRVSGKKGKEKSGGTPQFVVLKVSRDFGPCQVARTSGE